MQITYRTGPIDFSAPPRTLRDVPAGTVFRYDSGASDWYSTGPYYKTPFAVINLTTNRGIYLDDVDQAPHFDRVITGYRPLKAELVVTE